MLARPQAGLEGFAAPVVGYHKAFIFAGAMAAWVSATRHWWIDDLAGSRKVGRAQPGAYL